MSPPRVLLAGLLVVTAVVVQTTVLVRLNLPYGRPDLIVVIVAAIALAAGPGAGAAVGFAAGLSADLLADHPAGMLALVFCLVGYAAGLLPDAAERGPLLPLLVVALASVAVLIGFAALLGLIGSPRLDWRVVAASLPGAVAYDVILAVFVVPVVAALHRRLSP